MVNIMFKFDLIPQIFHDFLARIIPGSVLIVVFPLVVIGPNQGLQIFLTRYLNIKLSMFWLIGIWLLISYFIGFVLGEIYEKFISSFWFVKKTDRKIEAKCKKECIEDHKKLEKALGFKVSNIKSDELPRDFAMRDHLRYMALDTVTRILKIRSERRLCQVLIIGGSLLAVLNFFYIIKNIHINCTDRIIMEIIIIVTVVFCWTRSNRLYRHYVNGITISWLYHILQQNRKTNEKNHQPV